MKRKLRLLVFILVIIMVMGMFPTLAFAVPPPGYDAHDFYVLQEFLSQASAVAGTLNGEALNPLYDPNIPATWAGVTWTTVMPYQVTGISWAEASLAGRLNVSDCLALTTLDCNCNQITSLKASGCVALTDLECVKNLLTSLDVSGCTELVNLTCYCNQLTSLDVTDCTVLTSLDCTDNQLTSLNVSNYTGLVDLYCSQNQLNSLGVSGCTALTHLNCSNNQLTGTFDVSGLTELTTLDCNNNRLVSLDADGLSLTYLDARGNTPLTQIIAGLNSSNIVSLAARGSGYVGLYYDSTELTAYASPYRFKTFFNWTDQLGKQVSTLTPYNLALGSNYNLDANFTGAKATITFNTAGGLPVPELDTYLGDTIATAPVTTRKGYIFAGWYTGTAPFSTRIIFPYTVTGSVTMYAKWTL